MFGRKQILPKTITIKICKYCSSSEIHKLETSSGFGGGPLHGVNGLDGIYYCLKCGKITDSTEFTTKVMNCEDKNV